MEDEAFIRVEGVSFTYRDAAMPALSQVTFAVRRGEFVVLMGATGAGKTTLAKCLARIVPVFERGRFEGVVRIDGQSLQDRAVSDLAGVVGFVSQDFEAQLFATSVRHEVAFGLEQLGVPPAEMESRLEEALDLVGLAGFEKRDPASLSGGEKQRLAIAAVLALKPRIFVFDEPTTDLDPAGKTEVFAVLGRLRRAGFTIVLIEHEIAAAEHADRLLLMHEGRLVADDAPARLLPDVDRLERLGVRPSDLDRLARALGHEGRFASLDDAEAALRPRLRACSPTPPEETAVGEPILTVEAVSFAYDNGRQALTDVSLVVREGEIVALIGQNGSGKTTLARHLNGLLRPLAGTVRLRGQDLRALSLHRVAADVGYVFQNPDQQIFAASVRDEVEFGLRNFGIEGEERERRVASVLDAVGLRGLEAADPFLLGKGQRQRLAVASLLALGPRVLILDEPTTGLDYPEQRRMMELLGRLRGEGMTVVVITHSPWVVAESAERGILMQAGQIAFDGALGDLFERTDLLEGCRFRVPDVTRLGLRLGVRAMTVDELLVATGRGD